MGEFRDILSRSTTENVLLYLLYNSAANKKILDINEDELEEAYDMVFEKLEKVFPAISRDHNEIFDAIVDFAMIHDEIYFEMGLLTGFNLYRNLEHGCKSVLSESMVSTIMTWMDKKHDGILKKDDEKNR